MADTIVRLKVESSEYEQKLKRASQALLQMAENAKRTGAALDLADKEEVEFVRSLGKLQTSATTTRGKVGELSQAFTELSVHYRQLDDETKKSAYGKGLSSSIEELKGRAQEAKKELSEVNSELNSGGESGSVFSEMLDAISSKLGINVSGMGKLGAAVAAAGAALKVAKDSFFNSELNIDAWARTVEGAKGAYSLFLDTLNGGNWKNFFANLNAAIQGSKELADTLDRMESVQNNNAAAIAIEQRTIQELRMRKYQGENVDAELESHVETLYALQQEGVEASMAAGRKAITESLRRRIESIKDSEGRFTDEDISALVDRLINEGQGVYDEYTAIMQDLTNKGSVQATYRDNWGVQRSQNVFNYNRLSSEDQSMYILAKAIVEGETELAKGIAMYAQAISQGTQVSRESVKGYRYSISDVRTSATDEEIFPAGSIADFNNQIKELQEAQNRVNDPTVWKEYEEQIAALTQRIREMKGEINEVTETTEDTTIYTPEYINKLIKESEAKLASQKKQSTSSQESSQEQDKERENYSKELLNGLNNVSSGLQKMGVTLPSEVDKAIGSINGVVQVLQGIQAVFGVLQTVMTANTAATISNTTAMATSAAVDGTEAFVDAAIGILVGRFANGGVVHAANGLVVPGMSYSGDKVPALLNSGELILNRAQQGNLAAQLSDAMPTGSSSSQISGEQILIVMNNYLRRIGRGEILTSK